MIRNHMKPNIYARKDTGGKTRFRRALRGVLALRNAITDFQGNGSGLNSEHLWKPGAVFHSPESPWEQEPCPAELMHLPANITWAGASSSIPDLYCLAGPGYHNSSYLFINNSSVLHCLEHILACGTYRRVLTQNVLFLPEHTQDTFFPWAAAPSKGCLHLLRWAFPFCCQLGSTNSTEPSPRQAQQLSGGLWTGVPHKPSSAEEGMAFSWTKLLLWMQSQPVPASVCPSQKPCQGNRNGKLSPFPDGIAQGHHLDGKDWAWLQWKDSSEAKTSWNGSFLVSQQQNHKCSLEHKRTGVTELRNIPTQQLWSYTGTGRVKQ